MHLKHIFFVTLLVMSHSVLSMASQPWENDAFEASPQELLDAAAKIEAPEGNAAYTLYREFLHELDESGKLTRKARWVYRIEEESAIEAWSSTSAFWQPWYQNRPQIKARVINPDGSESWLDPAHIAEQSTNESDNIYSNSKSLKAPFPNVTVGSIVEEEIIFKEHNLSFSAGSSQTVYLRFDHPIHHLHVSVSVPKKLPFNIELDNLPKDSLKKKKAKGRLIYSLDRRDLEKEEIYPDSIPADESPFEALRYSTATSWQEVAKSYSKIVEDTLAGEDLSEIAAKLKAYATSHKAKFFTKK